MARHRSLPGDAGQRALATALACIAIASIVLRFDVGDGLTVPAWTVAVPLLVYTALATATLGRASLRQRFAWLAGACLTHAVFVVATAAIVAVTGPESLATALRPAIMESPLAPIIFVIGVPLTLLPFRGRLLPQPAARAQAPRPAEPAPPAADQMASAPPVADRMASPPPAGETPFAREARRRAAAAQSTVQPALSVGPAASIEPAPPPVLPLPAPLVMGAAPAAAGGLGGPSRPPLSIMTPIRAAGEDTVRIPFKRIAAQLPAEAFVLPMERLAESMRAPHELLVPRSLVIAQLGEGHVEVAWALVEDQFPKLGFALEMSEIHRRYPDLRLSLPLALVVPQVSPAVFSGAAPAADLAGLDRYPAPFQPSSHAPAAAVPPPVARTAPVPPAPRPLTIAEVPVVERPAMAAPASVAPPLARPVAAAPAPVETKAPAAVRTTVVITPVTPAAAAPPPALLAQGTRLATRLAALGPLEIAARRVSGTIVLSLVTAGLPHEAIERAAVRCAPLLSAAQQVTIHAERVSMVLTPVPDGVLVVALRAGSAVALLEILVGRARSEEPMVAAPRGTPHGLAAAEIDGRVAALRDALQGFGPVVPAAFVDRASGLDVYVFSAGEEAAQLAGEAARVVWQALVREGERDLGRAVSVVLREGTRRTVVHPVGTATRPAMLAAAGVLALPGLAYRQAAQAAARLVRV